MTAALDILAAIEVAAANRPRIKVDVPEWNCSLWFPVDITVAQQKTVRAGVSADDDGAKIASFILHMAEQKDGSKVFEPNAKSRATLEGKAGMRVMMRIMEKIGSTETVGEAKNA